MGVKEKDLVVAHVLDMLLTGRLRSGDRVDRNELTAALGLSRVPVQEALNQLEHDGIVESRYHRGGAFIHRFDADVLREHYEVHGLLTGAAAARAAADPPAQRSSTDSPSQWPSCAPRPTRASSSTRPTSSGISSSANMRAHD